MAGNRTRVDCLEGNHANLYTTIACLNLKSTRISKCKTRKSLSSFLFVDITNFHKNIFELFILYNFTKPNNQGPK